MVACVRRADPRSASPGLYCRPPVDTRSALSCLYCGPRVNPRSASPGLYCGLHADPQSASSCLYCGPRANARSVSPGLYCGARVDPRSTLRSLYCGPRVNPRSAAPGLYCGLHADPQSASCSLCCGPRVDPRSASRSLYCGPRAKARSVSPGLYCGPREDPRSASHISLYCGPGVDPRSTSRSLYCGPRVNPRCTSPGLYCRPSVCGHTLWRRGRFLIVFLLSLVSVRSSWCAGASAGAGAGAGAALGAQLVCARTPGLTDRQRAMCRAAPAAMAAIGDGLRMAYAECVSQMRGRRWNCSGLSDGKLFGHVISMATKEAAYTYAITSAGVTHALSAACARGELPACGCNNRRRAVSSEQWQWAGARCGDAAHGARTARRFLDARELEHDARALMNLHNNRLGRKIVKELVSRECKCHGVSGSCALRTCWRALPPFRRVAHALTATFLQARKVAAFERGTTLEGRVDIILVVKKPHRPLSVSRAPRKSELVYLEPSPSYCEPQRAAAALGTHGRHCNHTSRGEDGCEQLCCGRGHSTRRVVARVQCRCSFQWCCRVRCDTCRVETDHHICN